LGLSFLVMIRKNVILGKPIKLSTWRKSALGSYASTGDCSVYAIQKVSVVKLLEFLKEESKTANEKVSIAHFAGLACAKAIEKYPQINSVIRFGKIYPRQDINIFYQVAVDKEGNDLTGTTIKNINNKSILEIAIELNRRASEIRSGNDKDFKQIKKSVSSLPGILMRPLLRTLGFIFYSLNLWSPLTGMPRDNFGSMMITNIGSLGLETAFAPLVDFSRAPLLLALGAVFDDVKIVDGVISPDRCVNLCWTLDHRLIDGVVGAKMSKFVKQAFESPESLKLI
jgi:pyruvate/2-oxoglutarate dehydrogenase complex dihydrolipoamide acyltransferase (E2) component